MHIQLEFSLEWELIIALTRNPVDFCPPVYFPRMYNQRFRICEFILSEVHFPCNRSRVSIVEKITD